MSPFVKLGSVCIAASRVVFPPPTDEDTICVSLGEVIGLDFADDDDEGDGEDHSKELEDEEGVEGEERDVGREGDENKDEEEEEEDEEEEEEEEEGVDVLSLRFLFFIESCTTRGMPSFFWALL